jgi:hypothetical protein
VDIVTAESSLEDVDTVERRRSMKVTISRNRWARVAVLSAGFGLGASLHMSEAETWKGPGERPLESRRYETLRGLARHLDETAQGALEGAADAARHGTSSDSRFLSSIRTFAQRAHGFRTLTDEDKKLAVEVPARVNDLTMLAHQVDDRIRAARALESTYDDWDAVLDVLERMRLLLDGREVTVPSAHVVAALAGGSLEEFRQLALALEISATRAHDGAKRTLGDYRDRGRQFLGELEHFAAQSRDLHGRADAGEVNPQEIGPLVDRVLEDARQADRRMRDARVFTSVWDDSGRTIVILERMANLVRS